MINKISASDTVADHYSVFYTPIHSPFPNFFAALSFFPPILIAHSNVKRLLGLSYEQMIGRQLTEVFSSNSDDKPPVIAYSELFHPDGQLKSVYGKAVCPFRFA
ncbi:unnamed protein product [Gongylonema pulchrum]|uniref:PAS domain-containing protein n=1 Tax=Gongylonema pulchrum TaxID=637853 RepID=A0A183E699_9BILA|nr:unnamed protein product [Gongylonema pulchrum]